MYRDKLVILFIFGLSTVMGGYAWWHHYQQGRRSLRFWGAEAAELIRYAPHVEAIVLGNADADSDQMLTVGDRELPVVERGEVSDVRGLVHARQALIEDASYLWDAAPRAEPPQWNFALRFSDGEKSVIVVLEVVGDRVGLAEGSQMRTLKHHLMAAYQMKIPEWLGNELE